MSIFNHTFILPLLLDAEKGVAVPVCGRFGHSAPPEENRTL